MERKFVSGISDRLANKIMSEQSIDWVVLKIQPATRVFGIDPKWKADDKFFRRIKNDGWDFSMVCNWKTVNTGQMLNIWG